MPLTGNVSSDIAELMRTYKRKGKIGNITPKSGKKAQSIAAAIAYKTQRQMQ